MTVRRLTKRTIDALQPTDRDLFVWDAATKGFGLKVTPKGRRTYIVQYRRRGESRLSAPRRMTLGTHGALTVDEARRRAQKILNAVFEGRDPATERAEERGAPTVLTVAAPFLADMKAKRKPTTYYEYARHFSSVGRRKNVALRGEIVAHFGDLRVKDVTTAQICDFHDRFRDRPYAGNRLIATLSTFFSWCERRGYRAPGTNPCRGAERFPERKRERYLTREELSRLGAALAKLEREGATSTAVNAIHFLLRSGFREAEALGLKWSAIDFNRGSVTLDESKTGRSVRYLGSSLLAWLGDLPQFEGSPFVFPGREAGTHLVEIRRVWNHARREAGLENVRLHDLRHSFATMAASDGASLHQIGAMLGHRDVKSTARYAHLTGDAQRLLADKTAATIDEALASGLPHSTNTAIASRVGRRQS